jgi:predicted Fe-Mo cluster-binding NifX family protein
MKIAISSDGTDLGAALDPRFGRCRWFVIVDTDSMAFEVFENAAAAGSGAGIQAAQTMASKGAQAVITGQCGPNAADTLRAAGVVLFTGQSGKIKELVQKYQQGQMTPSNAANAPHHAGTGGRGMGGGRGLGGGRRFVSGR